MSSAADLFAQLWAVVEPHQTRVVQDPWHGRLAVECSTLTELFRHGKEPRVPHEVVTYLAAQPVSFATSVSEQDMAQRAFVVMCALDDAAMDIHPAMKTRIPGRAIALSALLEDMKTARTTHGRYGHVQHVGSVIAKGQLTSRRIPDESQDASGSNLESQFAYLAVVPDPKPHGVQFLVVSPYKFGMLDDKKADKVGIAPIAEDADDLTFTASARLGRGFLDARPTDSMMLGSRAAEAIASLLDRGAGVVALPELVCSSTAIEAVQTRLRTRRSGDDGLVVCGSGLSADPCPSTGRHFNEASVLTARGKVLFKQQKIHPFNMRSDRMTECLVSHDPSQTDKPHMEDIAASSSLVVCDLPTVGRIIVMICEDFQQLVPTGGLALATRPDWIFAPLLDVSLDLGRWMHKRCTEIGTRSLSRIVVTSSTTLSVRRAKKKKFHDVAPDTMGIGILYDGHAGQRVKRVLADTASPSPCTAFVDWDSANWHRDNLTDRP